MSGLTIEYVGIDEIKPYEHNAKLHPPEQIEQIRQSILAMRDEDGDILSGFKDPIGIWHGEIVEGHGRYEAAKLLGLKTLPIIRLDGLTDEQRKAYALIHNKLTMNSGFDLPALKLELADISEIDMGKFDFEIDEINLAGEQQDALALDLDEKAKDNSNAKNTCHCPKCGFVFEV